eukprot:5182345-Pleurochrysis_carterae.AAC.6
MPLLTDILSGYIYEPRRYVNLRRHLGSLRLRSHVSIHDFFGFPVCTCLYKLIPDSHAFARPRRGLRTHARDGAASSAGRRPPSLLAPYAQGGTRSLRPPTPCLNPSIPIPTQTNRLWIRFSSPNVRGSTTCSLSSLHAIPRPPHLSNMATR